MISRIQRRTGISRIKQEEQDNLEAGDTALYKQLFTDPLQKQLRNKRS